MDGNTKELDSVSGSHATISLLKKFQHFKDDLKRGMICINSRYNLWLSLNQENATICKYYFHCKEGEDSLGYCCSVQLVDMVNLSWLVLVPSVA